MSDKNELRCAFRSNQELTMKNTDLKQRTNKHSSSTQTRGNVSPFTRKESTSIHDTRITASMHTKTAIEAHLERKSYGEESLNHMKNADLLILLLQLKFDSFSST